jgi:predicted DsbA family dithiol-disulfide isomerase
VQGVLAGDRYVEAVRADEARALSLGIRGVPFFLLDGKFGISGAQSPEVLRQALERAAAERAAAAGD